MFTVDLSGYLIYEFKPVKIIVKPVLEFKIAIILAASILKSLSLNNSSDLISNLSSIPGTT